MIVILLLNWFGGPRGAVVAGLDPHLAPGERGPEARRQRVVPPLAAGVFLAGLVLSAGVIATTFVSSRC